MNKFDEEGYDEIPNLNGITVQQLKTELNMKSGHANRLHRWLKKRNRGDEQDDAADRSNLQLGLHQQHPARKKRCISTSTSISSSVSSSYMAPEMKVEDSDDDDDDHDDHDNGNDEDDDDDCEIISSTQFTQPQSQSSSSNNNAAVIHRQHHRHQSTPAKTPKKRRMPVRTPPPPAARQLSFGRRTTRFPDRAIRTLLDDAGTCAFVRPKDNVRIYLEIPYEKKDFGKSLGAWFDWGKKKWYVMSNHDAKNGYDKMRHLVSLFGHDNSKYPFDE